MEKLKFTMPTMDELIREILRSGKAANLYQASEILANILRQRMNDIQDVEQAKAFEEFLESEILADKGGRPAWENAFKNALETNGSDSLGKKKLCIANTINRIHKKDESQKTTQSTEQQPHTIFFK